MHYKESGLSPTELLTQFHLIVETKLSAVEEILPWFEKHCIELLDKTTFLQMQIVLVEGFTNTVKYAHSDLDYRTPIELLVSIFKDFIEIKIWDYGKAFDLSQQLEEELKTPPQLAAEKESHRGILLMNALSDELNYIRESQDQEVKNCLIIRKKITAAPSLSTYETKH